MKSIYCKIYRYLMYSYDAVSPWMLVYFVTDRLLTIVYSQKILRQKNIQIFKNADNVYRNNKIKVNVENMNN